MAMIVYFVRHGEVAHHRADLGLTRRGREQARGAGQALAADIGAAGPGGTPGPAVSIHYSPVRRVRETAEILHRSLAGALGAALPWPEVDLALSNVRFITAPDQPPAEPSLLYAETGPGSTATYAPEQAAFYRGFWSSPDPMGYWLASACSAGVETPAAVWARLRWRLADVFSRDGSAARACQVLVSHSGTLRLLVRQALGADPGEPRFCEWARLEAGPAGSLSVAYRGQTGVLHAIL